MQKLKSLRASKKLTQQEVADALEITRSTYSKYENGVHQPSPALLQKFADFFSVSIDYLLNHTLESKDSRQQHELIGKISEKEREMIKKYRQLDQRGKLTVSDTIDREYDYIKCDESKPQQEF